LAIPELEIFQLSLDGKIGNDKLDNSFEKLMATSEAKTESLFLKLARGCLSRGHVKRKRQGV
jgi:hypothetical protein